jgi:conjugative relaxase-like TrwC/TraI family protein
MMTIHKLTAGDGYTYLLRQVAGGDVPRQRGQDAAGYFTAEGNPPGRWAGQGAELLGVAGQEVTEAQMRALFGMGMHPRADEIIASYLRDHVTADMGEDQLAAAAQRAERAASLGSPFPAYQPVAPFAQRVADRVTALEAEAGRPATTAEVKKIQAAEARRARTAVAGFDVVFAPVKSAALVWALDERPQVRAAVRAAHEAARDATLAMLEQHAAYTRTGKAGIAQLGTAGLTMAVFDHRDSRAGEPNLHTHVVISAKVRGTDRLWRALDARPLYRITVAASEFYNTRFEIELPARLARAGYAASFTPRPDTARNAEPVREITGVPAEFIAFFSSRRAQVEARYQQLIREYRHAHGYDPPAGACHRLARQANLDTRQAKGPARSLNQMRADWHAALTAAFGPGAPGRLAAAIPAAPDAAGAPAAALIDVAAAARQAVAATEQARSTWTAWNIRAEAERIIRHAGAAATPRAHDQLAAAITGRALSPGHSIPVTAPALATEPASLRRPGGESVFTDHAAARYTSAAILAAEHRLVTAATTPAPPGITGPRAAASLDAFERAERTRLDPGQRALVTAFAAGATLLAAGIGPAGSGKTTAMRAYAHVTAAAGIKVIALAPSAAAADVLSAEMGVPADTVHKFLHKHTRGPHRERLAAGAPVTGAAAAFALRPGDVVLVDEAGMAGTLHLDQLTAIAAARGAVVRLLGDYRQLSAPGCGGALRLITSRAGAAELTALYRFADPAEAAATLQLRSGDTAALGFYAGHDRIRAGSLQAMTDAAYDGWKADMTAGRVTIMTAAATVSVTALSARARQDRVAAGQVEAAGIPLRDGNLAGAGDWITTRSNNRRLATAGGRDWVKNGDAWQVTARHPDGSLTARRLGRGGTARLPAAYVAAHVELLYATTTHRAQGATVDTAHPLVTEQMGRENLYVAATRARHRTTLYVVTHELPGADPDDNLDRARNDPRMHAALEILTAILARETGGKSATETITDTLAAAGSLTELAPRLQHALEIAVRPAYKKILRDHYDNDRADALAQTPGYAQLRRALLAGEQAGHHPARLLARAATRNEPQASQLPDEKLIEQLTTHITAHLRRPPGRDPRAPATTPAWLTIPASAATALSPGIPGYLRDLSDVITARVTALTEIAAATRPAWTRALGVPPAAPRDQAAWKACLATVAAYRDQHAVTTGEPRHILGPRPEPGTSDEPAWQHATAAITAARRLAARRSASAVSGAQGGYGRPRDPSYRAGGQAQHAARRDLAAHPQPRQARENTAPPLLQPPPSEPRQHGRQIGS